MADIQRKFARHFQQLVDPNYPSGNLETQFWEDPITQIRQKN